MPDVPLIRNPRIRRCLGRLLYVWATRHPASGYVQGINNLATPLLAVFVGERIGDGAVDGVDRVDGVGCGGGGNEIDIATVLNGPRMGNITDSRSCGPRGTCCRSSAAGYRKRSAD